MRLPASKAHIWAPLYGCRAWGKMSAPYRNQGPTAQATREGLTAHQVARDCLEGGKDPLDFLGHLVEGVIVDQEMVDAIGVWVATVGVHHNAADFFRIEDRLPTGEVVDAWAYYEEGKMLHVWDFKYGWRIVEPEDNYQLCIYAREIREAHNLHVEGWALSIVQPRPWHYAGPCRRWFPTMGQYQAIMERVEMSRVEAENPEASCTSGPHCVKCEARHACNAAHMAAMAAIDHTAAPTPAELSGEEIGYELGLLQRAEEAIKLRLTGLETQVMAMMERGETVTGWQRAEKRSSLKWTAALEDVAPLADTLGVEIRKPQEMITPTQAIKAGLPRNMVEEMATKYAAGYKLQRIKQEQLNRIFGVSNV